MTRAVRRWAGRTGNGPTAGLDAQDGAGIASVNPSAGMAFATAEDGSTVLRWSNTGGISPFFLADLSSGIYWQNTYDFCVRAVPSAALLVVQHRSLANNAAYGNQVLGRSSGSVATWIVRSGGDRAAHSTVLVPLNVWHRQQTAIQKQTAAGSDGKFKSRVTRLSDGVIVAQGEFLNVVTGTSDVYRQHTGKLGTASTLDWDVDDFIVGNDAYEFLDPPETVRVDGTRRGVTSRSVVVGGARRPLAGTYRIVNGVKVPIT